MIQMNCKKCGEAMVKEGVMDSGNSRYENYVCKACRHTAMRCIGLNSSAK